VDDLYTSGEVRPFLQQQPSAFYENSISSLPKQYKKYLNNNRDLIKPQFHTHFCCCPLTCWTTLTRLRFSWWWRFRAWV